jgi:hypothetical protein
VSTPTPRFAIFHREREYAYQMGDPILTEVEASTKEEAERLTAHLGMTGTIAISILPPISAVLPPPASRSLKIEAHGDVWEGRIKPKIRIMGRWLEQAGFKPGGRVEITCLAPGLMELRSAESVALTESLQTCAGPSGTLKESVGSIHSGSLVPQSAERGDIARRTPDQFAFCGPHFYNSSPRTRALGTYWQHCFHCRKALDYFSTCEEARANKRDCVALPTKTPPIEQRSAPHGLSRIPFCGAGSPP